MALLSFYPEYNSFMGCRSVVFVLMLSCSSPPPPQSDAIETTSLNVTLTIAKSSAPLRRPYIPQPQRLALKGTCPLSDGIILIINLSRQSQNLHGDELRPAFYGAGSATAFLDGGKFALDASTQGPGMYVAKVRIPEEIQDPERRDEVRKRVTKGNEWAFEFDVWDDSNAAKLDEGLTDVQELVTEVAAFLKKCETAAGALRDRERDLLLKEGRALSARIEQHRSKLLFPAAVNTLSYVVRQLTGYQSDMTWDHLKNIVGSVPGLAGREFCLWVVMDRRKNGGALSPAVARVLDSLRGDARVSRWADLPTATPLSELDALEERVRRGK